MQIRAKPCPSIARLCRALCPYQDPTTEGHENSRSASASHPGSAARNKPSVPPCSDRPMRGGWSEACHTVRIAVASDENMRNPGRGAHARPAQHARRTKCRAAVTTTRRQARALKASRLVCSSQHCARHCSSLGIRAHAPRAPLSHRLGTCWCIHSTARSASSHTCH